MVLALVNDITPYINYITYWDSHAFGTVTALYVHVFTGKRSSVPHGSHRSRIWSSASASWVSSSGAWDAGRSSPAPSNTGQPCKTSGPRSHHPLLEEEEEQEGHLDLNLEEEEEEEELPFLAEEEEEEEGTPMPGKGGGGGGPAEAIPGRGGGGGGSIVAPGKGGGGGGGGGPAPVLRGTAEMGGEAMLGRGGGGGGAGPVFVELRGGSWFLAGLQEHSSFIVFGLRLIGLILFSWSRRPHKSLWMIPYRRRDAAGSSHTSPSQLNPQRERKITWWNHHISSVPYRLN